MMARGRVEWVPSHVSGMVESQLVAIIVGVGLFGNGGVAVVLIALSLVVLAVH